jgi:CBS domain-containing protein
MEAAAHVVRFLKITNANRLMLIKAGTQIRPKLTTHFATTLVGVRAMKVKDAMHKGAEWVEPSTPISKIAALMKKLDVGAIPVGENDRLVGMVTDRDIACRAVADSKDCSALTARDVMTKGIVYCSESEDLADALRIMEQKKIRRLPVINDKKRMVGILSLGDISHAASHELSGEVMAAVSAHHA